MTLNQDDSTIAGIKAFQSGDYAVAYERLSAAISSKNYNYQYVLAAGLSARALGRHGDALAAAEKILSHNETDAHALVLKGDAMTAMEKTRPAMSFYLAALKNAPANTNALLQRDLQHAQRKCAEAAEEYQKFLQRTVSDAGLISGDGASRNDQATEILLGKKQIYYQQPEKFYFPELPQRQFYDQAEFDWAPALVAAAGDIRSELQWLLQESDDFVPYVDAESDAPHVKSSALTGNKDWSAFHLMKDGKRITKNAERCPKTMAALAKIPAPIVAGKSPIALFSRLAPGAHIPPHTGLMNTRLICHLPLITPDGCTLRVGNQTREWRDSELLIFDDSIEHEARNASNEERIVLLFDIWRPELADDERRYVSTIFDAIEEFGVF